MGDILFLAHRVPFPPNRGDKIRSAHLLRKLASLAPVHVGCFAENAEDRAGVREVAALAKTHCIQRRTKPLVLAGAEAVLAGKPVSLTAFHSQQLMHWVKETLASHPISTIVIFSGQMGQYVPQDYKGRVVIDLCDVDSAKFEGYASAGQRVWLNTREGRLLAREEDRLARLADTTILISKNEAQLFLSRLASPELANVQVMGNGIDARAFDPSKVSPHSSLAESRGPHLTFTGQMDYAPNEAAALWAIEELLPAVRRNYASAQFHVVGRSPTKALLSMQGKPGVTIWGEVPDVNPFIAASDAILAPLMIARGVQNKVLEAMAMAKPIVLTPEAATGINARDDEHWLISDADAGAMAARISLLIENPVKATNIGTAARQFVLDHHDWDAMLAPLEEWVGIGPSEARDAA